MSEVFLVTRQQVNRIKLYFPVSHGKPWADDRRVTSGIIYVSKNGFQWKDAPTIYGPHKTLCNRFVRWSWAWIFNLILRELAKAGGALDRLMIDATHLNAHRTAASLLQKGRVHAASVARKAA